MASWRGCKSCPGEAARRPCNRKGFAQHRVAHQVGGSCPNVRRGVVSGVYPLNPVNLRTLKNNLFADPVRGLSTIKQVTLCDDAVPL